MRRKVIQLAGKTSVVSLPAKWVREQHIQKGDELEVEIVETGLLIQPMKSAESGRKEVDISGLDPMIKRTLGALYKAGYNEFIIRFNTVKELKIAQEVVREEFIGFEVVDQKKGSIAVKKVSHIEPSEFNTMLRRMFRIIISMAADGADAIKKPEKERLEEIAMRDKDVNKIADFCRRVLNSSGGSGVKRAAPAYYIVEQLEKVGDAYRDIAQYIRKSSSNTNALFKEANAFFEQFYAIYFSFDLKEMTRLGKKRYALREKMHRELKKGGKDTLLISYLNTIVESTFDMNGPLMAINL